MLESRHKKLGYEVWELWKATSVGYGLATPAPRFSNWNLEFRGR